MIDSFRGEGDKVKPMEIDMKIKKQALLIALTSALALGAVTTSFAQEATQNDNGAYSSSQGAYSSSQYGPNNYVPGYGNTGAGSGPGGY
jgi:uncharacterized membrane protein